MLRDFSVSIKVTVEYKFEAGAAIPLRVHTVVISAQHKATTPLQQVRDDLIEKVIKVGFF